MIILKTDLLIFKQVLLGNNGGNYLANLVTNALLNHGCEILDFFFSLDLILTHKGKEVFLGESHAGDGLERSQVG